jgi:hypothetical protein
LDGGTGEGLAIDHVVRPTKIRNMLVLFRKLTGSYDRYRNPERIQKVFTLVNILIS